MLNPFEEYRKILKIFTVPHFQLSVILCFNWHSFWCKKVNFFFREWLLGYFKCCLAALCPLWAIVGAGGGVGGANSLTCLPKGHWELHNVRSQGLGKLLVGFELGSFQFRMSCLNPLGNSSWIPASLNALLPWRVNFDFHAPIFF